MFVTVLVSHGTVILFMTVVACRSRSLEFLQNVTVPA